VRCRASATVSHHLTACSRNSSKLMPRRQPVPGIRRHQVPLTRPASHPEIPSHDSIFPAQDRKPGRHARTPCCLDNPTPRVVRQPQLRQTFPRVGDTAETLARAALRADIARSQSAKVQRAVCPGTRLQTSGHGQGATRGSPSAHLAVARADGGGAPVPGLPTAGRPGKNPAASRIVFVTPRPRSICQASSSSARSPNPYVSRHRGTAASCVAWPRTSLMSG
jgi:hypothetical protein